MGGLVDLYESYDKISSSSNNNKKVKGYGAAISTWETFLNIHPCSFGFVCLMRLVRKYKGINACRDVFRRARNILGANDDNSNEMKDTTATTSTNTILQTVSNTSSSSTTTTKTTNNNENK